MGFSREYSDTNISGGVPIKKNQQHLSVGTLIVIIAIIGIITNWVLHQAQSQALYQPARLPGLPMNW